ncbi:hypothetical protein QBC35DRAFT_495362 [Podospora australis]|uniref:Uncharacterized protein n=1 Tax=Podospora australis TaxID=1536484 RepID=A0AAN7AJV6_9PEZI|nr:hypothetical protein QBC35DRAFT_495362 [Podospora australis]
MPALLRSATGKYTPARVAAWRAFLDQCRYEDEASQRLTQDPLPVPTGAALRPVPRGPEPPQPLSSNPPGLISVIPSSSSASSLSSSINTNVNPSIAAQQQRKRQANQRLLRQQQAHRAMQRHQKLELAEIEEELAENAVGVRDFAHERAAVNEQSQRQIRQDQELQLRLEQRQENQQKEQEKLSQEIQQELQNLVQEYRQLCIKRHRGPLVPQDEDRYRYLRNMTGPDTRSRVTRYRSSGSSSIDRMSPRERLVRLEFRRLISEDPYFDYTEEERKEELRKGRKKGNESSSAGGASVRMRDQQYASRQQYDHHLPNGGKNIDQNGKQPDLDEKDEESKTGGDEGKNSAVPAKKEDGVLDKVWFWARRKST